MKLPVVCLAAIFAGGVALGLFSPLVNLSTSLPANHAAFFLALAMLAVSVILLRKNLVTLAAIFSLGTWLSLGVIAAWCASQPPPQNHVLSLAAAGRLDFSTPLRWHACLRDEPTELPWGVSYDLGLNSVEFEGASIPIVGGIRLSYSPHDDSVQLPTLHAGDAISFVGQARLPQAFRNEGAFDRRAFLQQQGIDLTATLRSAALIERERAASFSAANALSEIRARLRDELNTIFPNSPQVTGVLRAMLLGDRSFIDRDESLTFQKTGVFHVLVVAGLHVGSFAAFLYWLGRKFRFSIGWTTLFLLATLASYLAVVEQRPPVLRAALMAAVLLAGGYFFRRLELLNSAAIAALLLLIARPLELRDSSFQLSFLAIGCIAGLAVPWMDRMIEPYVRGLRGWRDVTRDASHAPRVVQFRIDLRSATSWLTVKLQLGGNTFAGSALVFSLRAAFRVWELILLTLVLQFGMSPLMALDFHRVTLLGALANLLAVPLTGILVPAGFMLLLTGVISHFAALWAAPPVQFLTEFLIHAVAWFSRLPHGSYRVPGPPSWLTILFFTFAVCLCISLRFDFAWKRIPLRISIAFLLFAAALIAVHPFGPRLQKGKLELTVLDVGQGDSLFLASPAGHTLLIDGGGPPPNYGGRESQRAPDPGEEAVSPFLWSRGLKRIDVVALTHAHQDHLGGLPAVLENFQVGELWIGREVNSTALEQLEKLARTHKIPIRHEARGQAFDWDGVNGEVLWPDSGSGAISTTAKNNDSLVLRLQYRNRSFFLPGDAEYQTEDSILSENTTEVLHGDVLKVGHHGSKNSTTPEFLAAVHPQWAIISAGAENPYGHPSPELLQRLQNANAKILRTDQNGAIHVLTDGKRIEISCFLPCSDQPLQSMGAETQEPNPY